MTGLARGVWAVDTALHPRWPGMELGPHHASKMGPLLIRDPQSQGQLHPDGHLFKGAAERAERGDTPEATIEMMDTFGVETAFILVDSDDPSPALEVLERYPDRFFGKLYVRPLQGMEMLRKIDAIAKGNARIKGLYVTPFAVQKPPSDKVYYPLYVKAIELGLPVMINVGIPVPRLPGEVQDPLHLDEPLWFFPDLTIVMAHMGEPWEATSVKLMLKWPNLYCMTSGFAPRHYPEEMVHYANTRGSHKIIYGGFYPGLSYERLKAEVEALTFRDHVWPLFLRENAMRVFKLGPAA